MADRRDLIRQRARRLARSRGEVVRLTPAEVKEIRARLRAGESDVGLALLYQVTPARIRRVKSGWLSWSSRSCG